jgi:hypothetical protein
MVWCGIAGCTPLHSFVLTCPGVQDSKDHAIEFIYQNIPLGLDTRCCQYCPITYQYIPVYTEIEMSSLSMYVYIEVRTSTYQYVLVHPLFIVVYTDILISILPCTRLSTYRVQTTLYALVLTCPCLFLHIYAVYPCFTFHICTAYPYLFILIHFFNPSFISMLIIHDYPSISMRFIGIGKLHLFSEFFLENEFSYKI